ncbi:MAG: ornithine cyclodeaminase family protein [Planctomycetota bacterium]
MALLLSQADVKQVLDMKTTMEIVERAFAELDAGSAVLPQRTPIPVSEHAGLALFMPAYIAKMGALGAKIVTVYKENLKKHGLATVLGIIVVLDETTGKTAAVMDGGFITAMRTGAVSGIATKYMAREDAKVAAILGSGVQARTQVAATCEARSFTKYYVYSIDPPAAVDAFCRELAEKHRLPFVRAASAEAAAREADVLTLATSACEPIIQRSWLKPGCHLNGVGSHAPKMRELDEATVLAARIICDLTSACLAEAGDFIIPMNEGKWSRECVVGDLGAVVRGKVAGRTSKNEITLFKSVGLAIQDVSTALAVYQRARELGVGTEFEF